MSPPSIWALMISVVPMCVNQKICNMRFDIEIKGLRCNITYIRAARAYWRSSNIGKRVITGWHMRYKSKRFIPTKRVNWLNTCIDRQAKVNILIDFATFCSPKPIPSCIFILKTVRRAGQKPPFGHTKITNKNISKASNSHQTQPKWNI